MATTGIRVAVLAATVAVAALVAVVPSAGATTTLHVSPRGDDAADGSASRPLRTVHEAWQRIPRGASGDWRIRIAPGDYRAAMPVYWEDRRGRILIEAWNPRRPPLLGPMNVYGVEGLTLRRLRLRGGGDVFHCERCRGILLDRLRISGVDAQETVKFNQSADVTVRGSDIGGAGDNAFDAVAVAGLRLRGNRFHHAGDWCAYAKGGSSDVVVTGNLFTACGTGGFSAGQGTGLQWMEPPFLQYEAYGVVIAGNSVDDVEGAAFGVQGGYNVLIRDNVARRVGARSHVLEVVFGYHGCDGQPGDDGRERCAEHIAAGGWGTTVVDDGTNAVAIPNRHVYIARNVIANPPDRPSRWQLFDVRGPLPEGPAGGVPAGARADDDLRLIGNRIWDGDPDHALGFAEGACPAGSSCAPAVVRADNAINVAPPRVWRLRNGHLRAEALPAVAIPPPDWGDRPAGVPALWARWPS